MRSTRLDRAAICPVVVVLLVLGAHPPPSTGADWRERDAEERFHHAYGTLVPDPAGSPPPHHRVEISGRAARGLQLRLELFWISSNRRRPANTVSEGVVLQPLSRVESRRIDVGTDGGFAIRFETSMTTRLRTRYRLEKALLHVAMPGYPAAKGYHRGDVELHPGVPPGYRPMVSDLKRVIVVRKLREGRPGDRWIAVRFEVEGRDRPVANLGISGTHLGIPSTAGSTIVRCDIVDGGTEWAPPIRPWD